MKRSLSVIATLAVAACGSSRAPSPATTPTAPPAASPDAAVAEATPPPPSPDAAPPAPDPAQVAAALLADERAAYDEARPLFVRYCAACHTTAGKKASKKRLAHFAMDAYPFGGHHAATIGAEIREVLGLAGAKATMPDDKPGSIQGADLAVFARWADAWIKADQAGAHGAKPAGAGHDDDDDDHDHDHDHGHDHDDHD